MAPKVQVKVEADGEDPAAGLSSSAARLQAFGGALQTIGTVISGTVLAPFTLITAPAMAAAARHRDAVNQIRKTTGATGDQLAALGSTYEDVRRAARAGTGEAADAVAALSVALNVSGEDLKAASTSLIRLARAGGTDVKAAAGTVAKTLRAFGVEGGKAANAIDAMRGAAQFADGGVSALTAQLFSAAPTFKAAGLTLEESAAMVADLGARGVPADDAITALQRALLKLTKEGAIDAGKALLEHIRAIRDATTSEDAARRAVDLFGKRGLAMADSIRRGALDLARIKDMAARGPGTGAPVARLSKALTDLQIAIEQALLPLGQAIERLMLPAMLAWFDAMGRMVNMAGKVAQAFAGLPDSVQEALFIILGLAALAGPLLLVVGPIVAAIAEVIAVGVAAFGGVGLVVAAVALLTGGALVAMRGGGEDLQEAAGGLASKARAGLVGSAGQAVTSISQESAAASAAVVDDIGRRATGTGEQVAQAPAPQPAPAPRDLVALRVSADPVGLPEFNPPALPALELPEPSDAPWQSAYKWSKAFDAALGASSAVQFGFPGFVDMKAPGAAGALGDAVAMLHQIGTLKGVRFSEDPALIEAELARALAMLTIGDSMRLHAMAIAEPYAALMASLVGPPAAGGGLVGNSPAAWMARADELDRLAGAKAERDAFFIDQWHANQRYWSGYANERDAYWVGQAAANQYALTMAGIRPGVYLPGDIVAAAQQGWEQAARSNAGSFGSQPFGYAPPPPPPAPAAPRPAPKSAASNVATVKLTVGRAAPAAGPRRTAPLPDEIRDYTKVAVQEMGGPDRMSGGDPMRFWGSGSEFWDLVNNGGAKDADLRRAGGWRYYDTEYIGTRQAPLELFYQGETSPPVGSWLAVNQPGATVPVLTYADGSRFAGDPIDEVLIVRGDRR